MSGIVRAVHQSSSKLGDTPLVRLDLFESRLPGRLAVEPLQPTLQQNRALHRSTGDSHRPAADVELYSSTALSGALQRSTSLQLYTALYTLHPLHPLHPPSGTRVAPCRTSYVYVICDGKKHAWELSTERTEPLKRVLPPRATNQTLVCQTQAPGYCVPQIWTQAPGLIDTVGAAMRLPTHPPCRPNHSPLLAPAAPPQRQICIPSTEGGRGGGACWLLVARCHTRAGVCVRCG